MDGWMDKKRDGWVVEWIDKETDRWIAKGKDE